MCLHGFSRSVSRYTWAAAPAVNSAVFCGRPAIWDGREGQGVLEPAATGAFSSEVGTGSRKENATKIKTESVSPIRKERKTRESFNVRTASQ